MTNHLTAVNYDTECAKSQDTIPVVKQLESVFKVIPEEHLLKSLKGYYAGRNGYTHKILWRTYVAMTVLNLPSFASLIRTLENNPYLASACGINNGTIPSKFAYSRFLSKLQEPCNLTIVKNMMRELTRRCYDTFPEFGNKSVAIDATDLKAWSNGSKKKKSDKDAGWVVKGGTNGKKKFVWGYKLHLMVDTAHEIPITASVTRGNMPDSYQATPLLSQARYITGRFYPTYVICDAGYTNEKVRKAIRQHFGARPIIKATKAQKKILPQETEDWQLIFNRRTAIERVFGRMKTQRRLNNITVRKKRKVTIHSLIPVIVTQAMALAFPDTPRNCVS